MVMIPLLATLIWFPGFSADVSTGHDVGVEKYLRGTVAMNVDLKLVQGQRWRLDLFTGTESFIRSNRQNESPVRISPEHIRFPVGLRVRFPSQDGFEWGIFARHQSNHDMDSVNPNLARETIAYEVYGVDWKWPRLLIGLGVYYDRGTRLDGRHQTWPFDYYLGGLMFKAEPVLTPSFYLLTQGEFVGHRNGRHDIPHLNIEGHAELGYQVFGLRGRWRTGLRFRRIEDYQFLGDDPRYVLMIHTELSAR